MPPFLRVGIDDIDSRMGGCTTHFAALLVENFEKLGLHLLDYPHLVRLNPNTPWKTRGNAAVSFVIEGEKLDFPRTRDLVLECVEEYADLADKRTNPGIVFLRDFSPEVVDFYNLALSSLLTKKVTVELIRKNRGEAYGFNGGRGIIGALAAIGGLQSGDFTYELIAYRNAVNLKQPRKIDANSVVAMDEKTRPLTFNNYDPENGRVLITPHGPDPVFLGIRGETPCAVTNAYKMIRSIEIPERHVIFRTNQGTDAHIQTTQEIRCLSPYSSCRIQGAIISTPRIHPGGHVSCFVHDESGQLECFAYEPSGGLAKVFSKLILGDRVILSGALRPASKTHARVFNVEKLEVLRLAKLVRTMNPVCRRCRARMASLGRSKGFKCKKCGFETRRASKTETRIVRGLRPGVFLPPPRAHRHLTKPLRRYGLEKTGEIQFPQRLSLYDYWWR